MMQDGDKPAPRSSYDAKQATDAIAATSDEAIRRAFIASTLQQPSIKNPNRSRTGKKPTGATVINGDVGIPDAEPGAAREPPSENRRADPGGKITEKASVTIG
jgi:hypothetical protein